MPQQAILPRFLPPPLPNPKIPPCLLDHYHPRPIQYLRVRHRHHFPMHPRPRELAQGHPQNMREKRRIPLVLGGLQYSYGHLGVPNASPGSGAATPRPYP